MLEDCDVATKMRRSSWRCINDAMVVTTMRNIQVGILVSILDSLIAIFMILGPRI